MNSPCVFCEIVVGRSNAEILAYMRDSVVLVPLNPVVDGHVIVISKLHCADAFYIPSKFGITAEDAASWAKHQSDPRYKSVNFITSVGIPATQSINHLHIHIVPRQTGDGLMLPWTNQKV